MNDRPPCARCGEPMGLAGFARSGKQRWRCTKKDERTGRRVNCYTTTEPFGPYTPKEQPKNPRCPRCGDRLKRNGATPSGKVRWRCLKRIGSEESGYETLHCYSTTNPNATPRSRGAHATRGANMDTTAPLKFHRKIEGKRFIVTCSQNATPVDDNFFASLRTFCAKESAELIVVPIRYKNPTSRWTESQENAEVWVPEVTPYLFNQRKKLHKDLMLVGDVKTQPTASSPLTGFEGLTHSESMILAHTKIQLRTVPTPAGKKAKIMTTTGACTVPNYSDTKAGKLGAFHHSLGAVIVEVEGSNFFLRNVIAAKDGSFVDLDKEYRPDGSCHPAPRALALVTGDTHRAQMDKKVERATFGPGGMVEGLNPEYLVFHDLHDGQAVNHHERRDPFAQIALREKDAHRAEKEVREDIEWLKKVGAGRKVRLAAANHNDFLSRWLRDVDWRTDPDNSEFYLESALELVRAVKRGDPVPDVFAHWVERLKGEHDIRCLDRRESLELGGNELALHGDLGPNGARGSRMNLRRIGAKTVIGHSHSPGIEEGCYQVGTSSKLDLGYNQGPSSWAHCHCVVHANGRRQLLFVWNGKWRAEK